MTLSGQCPACRQSLALTEASLLAAPTEPGGQSLYRCQCGMSLVANDLGDATEIAAHCAACSSCYVVDRSGAGEVLPCRCGETVIVPTAILVEHTAELLQPTTPVQESQPEAPAPEPSQPSAAAVAALEPEPAVMEPVQLPIVAAPMLIQIQLPSKPLPPIADTVTGIEAEPVVAESLPLPIIAAPTLVQIAIPAKPSLPTVAAGEPVDTTEPESIVGMAVRLPIVARPILFQIELPPPQDKPAPQSAAIEIPSASETPSASEAGLDAERATDTSQSDAMTITCPGCGREYVVPRAEVGQTAECECGFVFVMRENIAALDSAFCSDLMPVQPLAIDRTGERKQQPIDDSVAVSMQSRPAVNQAIDREVAPRFRYSWLAWMAAGCLVITFAVRSLYRFRSAVPNESVASRSLPRPIVGPRPVSPEEPIELQPIEIQPEAPQLVDFESVETIEPASEPELVQQEQSGLSEFLGPIQAHFAGLRSKQVYDREVLYGFSEMVSRLDVAGVEFSVKDLFWLADCWEQLADRAASGELASKCYWQAAAALALSQSLDSISPAEREVAERRCNELSEKSRSNVRVAERGRSEDPAELTHR